MSRSRSSMLATDRHPGRAQRLAGLLAICALVAGCSDVAAPSSGSPSVGATPSMSMATDSPTRTSSEPSPSPTPDAAPTQPADGDDGWRSAGTVATARTATDAAELGDGRVLVMGEDAETYVNDEVVPVVADTVELWDPTTDQWSVTSGLPKRRFEPALVSLQDGRALVIGGYNEQNEPFSSAYAFDPATDVWTKVGLMSTARAAPAAAVLPDGRVLVAGGYFRVAPHYDDVTATAVLAGYHLPPGSNTDRRFADIDPPDIGYAFATAELFDPKTDSWSSTGSMHFARAGAAAVTLTDGRVLVVGSGEETGAVTVDPRAFETAELYDPSTGRFTMTDRLPAIDREAVREAGVTLPDGAPEPAAVGRLAALDDGGALLVGHAGWWKHQGDVSRTLRFDAADRSWTKAAPAYAWAFDDAHEKTVETDGEGWLGAAVAALPGGRTLVAGGAGSTQYVGRTSDTTTAFVAADHDWADLPAMPVARADGAAVALSDGSVLVVGGYRDIESDRLSVLDAVRFIPAP